jgi:iron complex transport system ATP-binding protein
MTVPPALPLGLRDVSVRYGERVALNAVSLSVPRGQFVALAGPNGSGKTTLIRAVLGFVPLAGGSIELFGRPSGDLSVLARAREVAWVPQEESPRDNVRLYDYVLYGRFAFHGPLDAESAEDRDTAERVLHEVGLWDRRGDGVLSLSGGERQRAILARALAQSTAILLLDEPTTHLDIGHQLDLLARVRSLSRDRGVTVVAAIHDLNLAARYADRIVVLSRGRLFADGPPGDVLSADLLERVWGISADLRYDPRTGVPYLLPQHRLTVPSAGVGADFGGTVHVVGGGGTASPYLRALTEDGYLLSAGVLPLLDSDQETAEALSIPTAVELPFAPVGPEARARNRELLGPTRAIVVAPFPVGPSNLANLEDLLPFAGRVPVLLANPPPIEQRDFTHGKAAAVYRDLLARGAEEVAGVEGVRSALGRRPAGRLGTTSTDAGPVHG